MPRPRKRPRLTTKRQRPTQRESVPSRSPQAAPSTHARAPRQRLFLLGSFGQNEGAYGCAAFSLTELARCTGAAQRGRCAAPIPAAVRSRLISAPRTRSLARGRFAVIL